MLYLMYMHWVKELKKKTWIDWIKIILAIDIASTGIGLILNIPLHIIAPIFGFITRIFLGILYIMLATLIFKKVFPKEISMKDMDDFSAEQIEKDAKKYFKHTKKITRKIIKTSESYAEKILEKIDGYLDAIEDFFHKRKKEAKEELQRIINKKD